MTIPPCPVPAPPPPLCACGRVEMDGVRCRLGATHRPLVPKVSPCPVPLPKGAA